MRKIELLAPAKNLETGMAAINYGADAVYIGAPKFGARAAVGNTLEDIGKLIKYAHQYWAKVFIAMNTILYDNELKEAEALIHELYKLGADALIVQDMGILEMNLPPIELHASTQTHNFDLERIQFLEKAGFKRIILARELSLEQIKEIKANTSVDLEYFVNGALCVCLSGQCYFSHAITGRSANRGECSQACRMKYNLEDAEGNILAKDKHLLSLKDLNLSNEISDIVNAGICSLKIEGRLKDISYIKNITSHYNQKLDQTVDTNLKLKRASSGNTKVNFEADPERTFNRGFTPYFFKGRVPEIANFYSPKALGKEIGKIIAVRKDHFLIKSRYSIHNGDGLCFFNKNKLLKGIQVNEVKGDKIYPNDMSMVCDGVTLYRNNDHEFAKVLKQDKSIRKISIDIQFEQLAKQYFIHITDEDGNSVSNSLDESFELAKNEGMAKSNIEKQLSKLGDSIYGLSSIQVNFNETPFIQAKLLNELRRKTLNDLTQARIQYAEREATRPLISHPKYYSDKITYMGNVSNCKAEDFYKKCGVNDIEKAFELQKNFDGKTLMVTKHCLRYEFGKCPKLVKSIGDKPGPLYLVDNNRKYSLEFNCQRCEMKVVLMPK